MTTAKRLSSAIPDHGFIARLGGDEFIIILTTPIQTQMRYI
ncbi:diguanylate cyclase domain-containing protein [Bacillus atrophaeus]|nr:diguanylate cyclase [Bacillus atrophaeus]